MELFSTVLVFAGGRYSWVWARDLKLSLQLHARLSESYRKHN